MFVFDRLFLVVIASNPCSTSSKNNWKHMHLYTHTYMCTHTHTYIYTHAHVRTLNNNNWTEQHALTHLRNVHNKCTHNQLRGTNHIPSHTCMCAGIYVYTYIHVHIYIYMYAWKTIVSLPGYKCFIAGFKSDKTCPWYQKFQRNFKQIQTVFPPLCSSKV